MHITPTPVYLGRGHRMRAPQDEGQEQPVSALTPQLFPGGEHGSQLLCDPRQAALLPGVQVGQGPFVWGKSMMALPWSKPGLCPNYLNDQVLFSALSGWA